MNNVQYTFRVADGRGLIGVLEKGPNPLLDLEMLHKTFLLDEIFKHNTYYSECSGFEEALKANMPNSASWVELKALVPLPCEVKAQTDEVINLSWKASSDLVIYIRLKAIATK